MNQPTWRWPGWSVVLSAAGIAAVVLGTINPSWAAATQPTQPQTKLKPLPRAPVSGRVTVGGKPLPEGRIMFVPAEEDKGRLAIGTIKNGKYASVTTFKEGDGALIGTYKVQLSWPVYSSIRIDPKFRSYRKSPLTVTIQAGPNRCDFDLPAANPTGAAVSGTVHLDKQPLAEGIVLLVPTGKARGPAAMGVVTKGRFEQVSASPHLEAGGAVPGQAKVVVHIPPEAALQVPGKYMDPKTTPLTVTIKEGKNHFDFKLPALERASDGTLVPPAPPTSPVAGTVTVAGQPLPEGTILLVPSEPGRGPAAVGTIRDGKFASVTAYRSRPGAGAVRGPAKVVILVSSDSPVRVSAEYGDFNDTPLRFTVKEGENRLDLDIPAPPEQ